MIIVLNHFRNAVGTELILWKCHILLKAFDYQQVCQMKYIYKWLGVKSAQNFSFFEKYKFRLKKIPIYYYIQSNVDKSGSL